MDSRLFGKANLRKESGLIHLVLIYSPQRGGNWRHELDRQNRAVEGKLTDDDCAEVLFRMESGMELPDGNRQAWPSVWIEWLGEVDAYCRERLGDEVCDKLLASWGRALDGASTLPTEDASILAEAQAGKKLDVVKAEGK